ncbi:MAG: mechanosensitive ion channel [Leptospirales bacterium]
MTTSWTKILAWFEDPFNLQIAYAVFVFLALLFFSRLIWYFVRSRVPDRDVRYRVRKISNFALFLIGALVLASIFSDRMDRLGVAVGVAGAGIAFALQEIIASFAGWIAITFINFFRVGDRVQLGGIVGDVIDVGVLRTTIMECGGWVRGDLYNGRIVRVANSFVFKEPVYNYSADFPFLWDEIRIPIRHGSNIAGTRALIEAIVQRTVGQFARSVADSWDTMVRQYRIEDARLEPLITITADQNHILFTIRYVVGYKQRRVTQDQLFTEILTALESNAEVGSIAAATLEIQTTPELSMALRRGTESE